MTRALKLFGLQFCLYFIVTLNMRSVADLNYPLTFLTDVLIGAIGFSTFKELMKAETRNEQVSYILGGALGAQVALVCSYLWSVRG